jgi:hypothetical protein
MEINIVPVLIAVVANFILGFLWYTPLFGKAWAREMGFDTSVKPTGAQLAKGMTIMVIGNFLLAYVFAHNIAAWGFVPGMEDMSTTAKMMSAVFFTWLGFYVPGDLSRVAWENKSWKLFFINTSYHFMMLLVAAAVIYNWN